MEDGHSPTPGAAAAHAATGLKRPTLSFGQIWNMCFGFLGLQFGFALQNSNVSRIFQSLGAQFDDLPTLWIAAPLTGLLVQPLIGYYSDRTWTRLGRRRPYFLVGAVLASVALVAMPRAPVLWVAAGLLWVLDASINVSMEPFRAFVGDQLNVEQRAAGYAMQSFFIGVGAVVASMLPWLLAQAGVSNHTAGGATGLGAIPETVRDSFDLGAVVLLAAVGWTVLRTREYPPDRLRAFDGAAGTMDKAQVGGADAGGSAGVVGTILRDLLHMPRTMRRLAPVQFFSWVALFAMWIYTTSAVTQVHYHTIDSSSDAYNDGANWVGVLFAAYNGFAALAAMAIPFMVRRFGLTRTHLVNLWLGAAGLLSMPFIRDPHWLLLSMLGVGFAWASILSLPYALLSDSVPAEKMGIYMGIFNFFIVIPQVVAATLLGFILKALLHGAPMQALTLGGVCFVVAGLLALRVPEP